MNVLKLFPVLLFSLLLTSQAIFLPDQVFAWTCCDCSTCKWKLNCVCPGTPGYCGGYACPRFTDDTDHLLVNSPIGNGIVDIERLIHLTKVTECTRLSFALRVLGDAAESLKVEAFVVNANNIKDNNLTFQLVADNER